MTMSLLDGALPSSKAYLAAALCHRLVQTASLGNFSAFQNVLQFSVAWLQYWAVWYLYFFWLFRVFLGGGVVCGFWLFLGLGRGF